MGRGSAKGSSPNKKGTGKAPARRRAAPKRTAKAAKPRRTRSAKPKSEAARLASELKEALQRQAATADILKVIASSRSDVQPVFETIVVTAARLLRCDSSFIMRCDGAIYSAVAAATLDGLRPVLNPAPRPVDPAADFPSRAIASKKNLYLPDWSKIELPAFERMVEERRGLNSALYLPMLREDQCIGVLGLASRHVNNFAARDIALAESFRDQALIAIENARLFNETKEALEQQTATSEVLEVISSSPGDLAPVFSKMLENATRVCGANFGIMNLYDGEKFSIVADHNVPAAFAAYRQRTPIPPQPGTAHGEVVRTHQVVQIRDVRETPAYQSGVPFVVRMADVNGARTLMTVPMLKEDELLGTITIYRTEVRLFTDKQVALLENFTRQAVIAIENTRLLKETQEALQRQTATADILKVIASSPDDVQPVFDAIAVRANKLVGGHATAVLRVAGDMAELAAFTPVSEEADAVLRTAFPMPFAGNPLLEIVKGGEISEISDTESEIYAHSSIRNVARARGFRSRLLVPLKTDGGVIGAINLTRVEPGSFADHHVQLLQTFADQAVIAIQNVRLFNETKEALERQTATADILKVIASSPSDVQPVFDAIAERANKLVGGHATTVVRIEGDTVDLAAFTPVSVEADAMLRATFPMPIKGNAPFVEMVQRGEISEVSDTESEMYAHLPISKLGRARGFRSRLLVPLKSDSGVIGAISVARVAPGTFAAHHVQLLQTFADQAVIAIQNVRLFNETKEALEQQTATSEVLEIISSSPGDLDPVFRKMLENACRACEANFGTMNLWNGEEFINVARHNTPPAFAAFRQQTPIRPHPDTPMARVARTHQVVHEHDFRTNPAYLAGVPNVVAIVEIAGARTILVVPMLKEDELIGTITIFRQEVRPFSDKQIALVENFTKQAVIAIENTRLLRELRERTDDLTRSLDDLRAAQDRLVQTEKLASLGQLTAGIAHEIKNPLNFVNNFSALSAELTGELNDLLKRAELGDKLREEVDELTRLLKENLEKVEQHGKRADSIVKNMLLHSREGSGEQRSADINTLVDESLNLAYHGARAEKAGFNITLQRDFDAGAGAAELFPQEITRALLNLISNGFYAATRRNAENGEPGFEPTLLATTKNLGQAVEIRIRDNGTGIPPEVKEKMFNPFFTTKPAGEGTGLGLSMTHDIIVKQHGGKIDVATEPGRFTEFTIVLPRTGTPQKTR